MTRDKKQKKDTRRGEELEGQKFEDQIPLDDLNKDMKDEKNKRKSKDSSQSEDELATDEELSSNENE